MSIFESVLGWAAPPSCLSCGSEGTTVCAPCSTSYILPFGERCWNCNCLSPKSQTCERCRKNGSPSHVWISTNYEGLARELVKEYKFNHQRLAKQPMAGMMAKTFSTINPEGSRREFLVMHVPTASSRIRQRGFDHTQALAKAIAIKIGHQHYAGLARLGQNQQRGSKRSDRLAQVAGNYRVKLPSFVYGKDILLVDDVLTTGATICEAAKALRQAGARKVDALVFAKRL